jgi:hypothetical protein
MRETKNRIDKVFRLTTHNHESTQQDLALPNPSHSGERWDTEPLDHFTTEARQLESTTQTSGW